MMSIRVLGVCIAVVAGLLPATGYAFKLPMPPPIRTSHSAVVVPTILKGTESQTGTYHTVDPSELAYGPNLPTWGLIDSVLVPDVRAAGRVEFDTMTFYVRGVEKQLNAYVNQVNGVTDHDGPFQ